MIRIKWTKKDTIPYDVGILCSTSAQGMKVINRLLRETPDVICHIDHVYIDMSILPRGEFFIWRGKYDADAYHYGKIGIFWGRGEQDIKRIYKDHNLKLNLVPFNTYKYDED